MVDQFADIAVGEALVEILTLSFKVGAAVTKGQVVKPHTHTTGEVCSVQPAAVDDLVAVGVALKSESTLGNYIPVLVIGVVKVTGVGAITMGDQLACAADGKVKKAETAAVGDIQKSIGRALQTVADGETGLIMVDCGG